MAQKQVRVRFAPSPTGYLHVGGARTVLYNWLYARHTGGKLILRIEDTDQARSTKEAEKMQIEDIHWLKLFYDEGPDVGGNYGPYRQSERLDIYKKYAQELIDKGLAYYCFCSDEELERKRELSLKLGNVPHYDGTCRKISLDEAKKRLASGEKACLRFKSVEEEFRLNDLVRGEVVFQPHMVGDFILLRSDGMPVYNFCCVIDDHLMEITHVIRAEEHLSNTVRQMMIYKAFNWELPQYAHCSIILGSDRQKLSKRHGATSVHQYAEEGYLQEALINFLLLLGWSPKDNKEIMSIDEMIQQFSLDRLHKAPAVFDPVKLRWMNSQYIKQLPIEDITKRAMPFLEKGGINAQSLDFNWLCKAVEVVRSSWETLLDASTSMQVFFNDSFETENEVLEFKKQETNFNNVVKALKEALESYVSKNGDSLQEKDFLAIQEEVKTKSGAKGKSLFMPMRVVLTGKLHGPELKLVLPLIGASRALKRVNHSFEKLGVL
jgi:glutamyl-tRNA synthetase